MSPIVVATIEPRDWLTIFTVVFGLIGVLATMIVYYRYRHATEDKAADSSSIETWRNLSMARKAALDETAEENKRLREKLQQLGEDLSECLQLREEVTKMNLRLQAKNTMLEKSVNRLEDRAGVPITNFDDPTTSAYSG